MHVELTEKLKVSVIQTVMTDNSKSCSAFLRAFIIARISETYRRVRAMRE